MNMTETQDQTQEKESPKTLLVRIKPFNPKRGHVLKTYSYRGIKFQGERGWFRVDASLADELKTVHQVNGDVDSPLAFDVCTDSAAKALDEREADEATVRKTADKSTVVDVTTKVEQPQAPKQPQGGARRGG